MNGKERRVALYHAERAAKDRFPMRRVGTGLMEAAHKNTVQKFRLAFVEGYLRALEDVEKNQ